MSSENNTGKKTGDEKMKLANGAKKKFARVSSKMILRKAGYLTVDQVAKKLKLSHSQVCRYIRGDANVWLPAVRMGCQWLIREDDVNEFERSPRGNPGFRSN